MLISNQHSRSPRRSPHWSQDTDWQSKWQDALSAAQIALWRFNTITHQLEWSPELDEIFGTDPQVELAEKFLARVCIDQQQIVKLAFAQLLQQPLNAGHVQITIRRSDGQIRRLLICGSATLNANGQVTGVSGTVQDITGSSINDAANRPTTSSPTLASSATITTTKLDRTDPPHGSARAIDASLVRENGPSEQTLSHLDHLVEQISHGTPTVEVLDQIVEQIEHHLHAYAGSIMFVDEAKRLRFAAGKRLPKGYVDLVDGVPIGPNIGSCGTAAYFKCNVFSGDIATDPLWAKFKHLTAPYHLAACWSVPILSSGDAGDPAESTVLGSFGIYFSEPHWPTPQDVDLLVKASQIAAIAIEMSRKDRELRKKENFNRLITEHANLAVWEAHPETQTFTFVSPSVETMLGYPREEWLEPGFWPKHIHHEDRERVIAFCSDATNRLEDHRFEYRMIHQNGSEVWVEDLVQVLRNESGVIELRGILIDITERKRVETELRRSENHLRDAQEIGGIGSFRWRPAEDALIWSAQLSRIFKCSQSNSETNLDVLLACIHDDDRSIVRARILQAVDHQANFAADFRVGCTAEPRWISMLGRVSCPPGSKQAVVDATCLDITERKRIEECVRSDQKRLQAIIDTVPGVIYTLRVNPQGRYTVPFASPGIEQLLGISAEAIAQDASRGFERLHAEDANKIRNSLLVSQRTVTPWHVEFRVLNQQQQMIWVESHAIAISEPDGCVAWHGFIADITERKVSQEKLIESESRFRQFASVVADLFWILDTAEQRAIYLSPAFQTYLGSPVPDSISIDELLQHFHPDDLPRAHSDLGKLLAGEAGEGSYRIIDLTGAQHWVSLRWFPIHDANGQLFRVAGVGKDITQQVRTEERLALQNAELFHASRISSLGLMAAALSHEINQPLNSIANYSAACSYLLTQNNLDVIRSQLSHSLDRITQASIKAGEIIRRLRSFIHKGESKRSVCDINRVMIEAVELMQAELRSRNVRVAWQLSSVRCNVYGDAIQLQQVFVNLLTNAVNAMTALPAHAREVFLYSEVHDDRVTCSVQDNGKGIPDEITKCLFEPFVTTKPQGSGIGLSICRSIIEDHGGTIRGTNHASGGALLQITLPISHASLST